MLPLAGSLFLAFQRYSGLFNRLGLAAAILTANFSFPIRRNSACRNLVVFPRKAPA